MFISFLIQSTWIIDELRSDTLSKIQEKIIGRFDTFTIIGKYT